MRDPVMIGSGGQQRPPRPLLRTTLGQILRRARRELRTLADVAGAARVSMPYLSELERGRKEASSEVLAAVCEALRIELSDLLAQAGRNLADERARRIKERTGIFPPDAPAYTGQFPADAGERAGQAPAVQSLDVPVVVPLDAVRRRDIPSGGHRDGEARASLAA